jgi:hypothetical protein
MNKTDTDDAMSIAEICDALQRDLSAAQARIKELEGALLEIEAICTESAGDCRKRMGTRVGNSPVIVRAALKK